MQPFCELGGGEGRIQGRGPNPISAVCHVTTLAALGLGPSLLLMT